MEIFVVDTSVIVKWFSSVDEKYVEQAQDIFSSMIDGKIKILTPDLANYELVNALLKSKKRTATETFKTLLKFSSLPLTIIPSSEKIFEIALEITEQYNLTIYDAIFLAVAKLHNATLVTENLKDQGKAKGVKVIPIADFSSTIKQ